MAKRPDLASFTTGGKKPDPTPKPDAPAKGKAATPRQRDTAANGAPIQRLGDAAAGEPGKVISTTIRLPEDAWKQAKILAVNTGQPLTRIFQLALDDYFERHGLDRLATR